VKEVKDANTGLVLEKYEYYNDDSGSIVKDGEYTSWYFNETKKSTGKFVDNKESGVWKYWNNEGVLQYEITYRNGLPYGSYKKYKQGILAKDEQYKWDTLHGESIKYYANGTVLSKCMYEKGRFNGNYICYDSTGAISQTRKYKHGIKSGKWQLLKSDGVVEAELNYENGYPLEIIGEWKHEQGNHRYYEFKKDGSLLYTYPTFGAFSEENTRISYSYDISLNDLTLTNPETKNTLTVYTIKAISAKKIVLFDLVKKIEITLHKVK